MDERGQLRASRPEAASVGGEVGMNEGQWYK
jgi:hypothetical protein